MIAFCTSSDLDIAKILNYIGDCSGTLISGSEEASFRFSCVDDLSDYIFSRSGSLSSYFVEDCFKVYEIFGGYFIIDFPDQMSTTYFSSNRGDITSSFVREALSDEESLGIVSSVLRFLRSYHSEDDCHAEYLELFEKLRLEMENR